MAAHNRHIRGKTNEVYAPVRGFVVVEAGDLLMYHDTTAGAVALNAYDINAIAADFHVYPISYGVTTGLSQATTNVNMGTRFCGVAMESSSLGVTEKISVATTGVFRYPLYNNGAVTVGSMVSMVSPTIGGGTAGASKQAVTANSTGAQAGSTSYLGYITKTESGATFVDFEIMTIWGDGVIGYGL